MKTEDLIKALLTKLDEHQQDEARKIFGLSYVPYILEYRYLAMRLPRRSGKTEALRRIHKETSSLLLVPYRSVIDHSNRGGVHSFDSLGRLSDSFRGRDAIGLKYRCILIDEHQMLSNNQFKDLAVLLTTMQVGGFLEKDFYILGLGT